MLKFFFPSCGKKMIIHGRWTSPIKRSTQCVILMWYDVWWILMNMEYENKYNYYVLLYCTFGSFMDILHFWHKLFWFNFEIYLDALRNFITNLQHYKDRIFSTSLRVILVINTWKRQKSGLNYAGGIVSTVCSCSIFTFAYTIR